MKRINSQEKDVENNSEKWKNKLFSERKKNNSGGEEESYAREIITAGRRQGLAGGLWGF